MTPAAGLDALTPSHAVRCHLVLDSGFRRSNNCVAPPGQSQQLCRGFRGLCGAPLAKSLPHLVCHSNYSGALRRPQGATVSATRDKVRRLARQSCCHHGAAESAEGWKQPLASPRWLAGDDPLLSFASARGVSPMSAKAAGHLRAGSERQSHKSRVSVSRLSCGRAIGLE